MTSENKLSGAKLFTTSAVEPKDELEERFERGYQFLTNVTKGLSEREANDALNAAICRGAQQHEDVTLGLMYVIFNEPQNAPYCYRDLTLLTRDGMTFVLTRTNQIIIEKYTRVQETPRTQLLWFTKELVKNQVVGADSVCNSLLRQIAGGDTSPKNIWLAESMLDIFIEFRPWLDKYNILLGMVVYTYLRLLVDHSAPMLAALKQREVDLCISLLREKFADCMAIGRDLVRLLQNVARIPEFEKLWKDILTSPTSLCAQFTGVNQLMATRTQRKFLISRLTPDMEAKMCFLLSKVRFGTEKRYQYWFQRQYLATPESQSLRCDLIRFICGVVHPSNEVLCSDIIPRWAVIGWLLTTCTSNVAASNAKLALFYDWLFFDPERDSIMNIEPAILVMYHSIRPHPAITATLLDFLCRIMSNFYPPLTPLVRQGVYTALRTILEKKVLQTLSPLFDNQKLDKDLRGMIRENFAEFCSTTDVMTKAEDNLPGMLPAGSMGDMDNISSILANEMKPVEMNQNQPIHTAVFSDEEEEEMPLEKLKVKEERSIKSILRSPPPKPVDESELTQHLDQLDSEIRSLVLELRNIEDGEEQCEVMSKLIDAVIKSDEFDSDMSSALAICLCQILASQFKNHIFPEGEPEEDDIEDSIGTSLFVIFRILTETPEEDPSRQPILMLMGDVYARQERLGYLLLYFLKASKISHDNMTHYKDFCKSLEGKDLEGCLLNDLTLCQEDDVRLFCYLIPDIYSQFSSIAMGNPELLNLIVSCIDGIQLQDLVCQVMQGQMVMFRKDSFLSILNASLEWETFEQYCLWTLISAHNIPVDYMLPILPKLEYPQHAEALTSLLLIVKQSAPTQESLKYVLQRDGKNCDQFALSILRFWSQEYEDKLAELVTIQLTTYTSTPRKNRLRDKQTGKPSGPAVVQILYHLEQLRRTLKSTTFFTHELVQHALQQVQLTCTEGQKSKFSDLLALTEYIDDIKTTNTRSLRGTRGKGTSGSSSTSGKLSNRNRADSDSSSSEDDEVLVKPKAKKRKKASLLGSDSD